MKKICFLLVLFFATGCSVFLRPQDQCGDFDVIINNKKYNNPILYVSVMENLYTRLDLVRSNKTKNLCKIYISLNSNTYDSFVSDDGVSIKEDVVVTARCKYDFGADRIYEDSLQLYYTKSSLEHRYSHHAREQSMKSNIADAIADDIFLNVLKFFSH